MRKARRSSIISDIFNKWPGRRIFGPYRFMPFFFLLGAALEFSMINWTVGETNFYRVYKKNQVEKEARSIIEKEKLVQVNLNKDFDVLVQKKVEEIKEQEMRNNR